MVTIGIFNKGDMVVCINAARSGDILEEGKVYIIKRILTTLFNDDLNELEYLYDLIGVEAGTGGFLTGFYGSRFRLLRTVNSNTKTI